MDALEFLQILVDRDVSADLLIFDPPYSLEQCKRSYESVGRVTTEKDTQVWGRWTDHKRLISKLIEPGGYALTFGWNSGGIGDKYGFDIIDGKLVTHGAGHNDTIVTVERRREPVRGLFEV